MISKQRTKYIKSLKLKKYRKKAAAFLVEGAKNVTELISSSYSIEELFVTDKFLKEYSHLDLSKNDHTICSAKELESVGTFQTNEYALAIAKMQEMPLEISSNSYVIALDEISDPGNLGTIIRIADWYNITTIIASNGTADVYNPKVINASMGSFTRVSIFYEDLENVFKSHPEMQVYGAVLDGENIHQAELQQPAIILLGNESNGISASLTNYITKKITIPRLGKAESLNVAVSTAIICDNIFRK